MTTFEVFQIFENAFEKIYNHSCGYVFIIQMTTDSKSVDEPVLFSKVKFRDSSGKNGMYIPTVEWPLAKWDNPLLQMDSIIIARST